MRLPEDAYNEGHIVCTPDGTFTAEYNISCMDTGSIWGQQALVSLQGAVIGM